MTKKLRNVLFCRCLYANPVSVWLQADFLEFSKGFQLLMVLICRWWACGDLPGAILNILFPLFLWLFSLLEWSQCQILSQDVHWHSTTADLHAGTLSGFLREEQQISEKWLLSLWHWHKHMDVAKWRHCSGWRSKAGVWSSGQLHWYS